MSRFHSDTINSSEDTTVLVTAGAGEIIEILWLYTFIDKSATSNADLLLKNSDDEIIFRSRAPIPVNDRNLGWFRGVSRNPGGGVYQLNTVPLGLCLLPGDSLVLELYNGTVSVTGCIQYVVLDSVNGHKVS